MAFEVRIRRDTGSAWSLRSFHVEIDHQTVGELRNGDVLVTEVVAGSHHVRAFVGSSRSNAVMVDGVGEPIELVVRVADWATVVGARGSGEALDLVEDDGAQTGPTLRDMHRALPPSFSRPARTRPQRIVRAVGLFLAVAGFALEFLVRGWIGEALLIVAAIIFVAQSFAYLRSRKVD